MWNMNEIKDASGSQFLSAVTHASYLNLGTKSKIPQLARRGDKILGNVVAEYRRQQRKKGIKKLPGNPDFESASALFLVGLSLSVQDVMRMSRKERGKFFEYASINTPKHIMRIVSEPVEALIGAIEHHSGYEIAKKFVYENIIVPIVTGEFVDVESILKTSRQRHCIFP